MTHPDIATTDIATTGTGASHRRTARAAPPRRQGAPRGPAWRALAAAGLVAAIGLAAPAMAQEGAQEATPEAASDRAAASAWAPPAGSLSVELNKFEDGETGDCRAFFLFRNTTGKTFEGFEMSLAILDGEGVIDRLLSIDAAPLPDQRTTLKLFEIPGLACADISQVLLHEIPVCKPQNEAPADCFPFLALSSKTRAPLVK